MPSPSRNTLVLDISHHNVVTDFAKVYRAGVRGIVHKATQDVGYVDTRFIHRTPLAKAAGLLWGAYHFASDARVEDQVSHFLLTVERAVGPGALGETLLALDWEPNTTRGQGTMTIDQARRFLNLVAVRTGQMPVLYSGHLLKQEAPHGDAVLCKHRLWLAHYTNAPTPFLPHGFDRYFLWQWTDGSAKAPPAPAIPGIESEGVDCNHYEGDAEELAVEWVVSAVPAWEDDTAVASIRARVEASQSPPIVVAPASGQKTGHEAAPAAPQVLASQRQIVENKPDKKPDIAAVSDPPHPGPRPHSGEREQTVAPAMAAAAPQRPGFWSLLRASKSLKLLLGSGLALVSDWLGYLRQWLDTAWDIVLWTVGALPEITGEVKTTLTSSEEVARWFKVDWGSVLPKVALVVGVIVFLRHLADKRALEEVKRREGEAPAP